MKNKPNILATESLSQISISKILISETVYENWRIDYWQLTVKEMQLYYGLSALCDLDYIIVKISGTFIERLLVETLHVDGHVLNSLCTFRPAVTRIKK